MGRIVLGIVVGYMAMFVWVMATAFLAARLFGSEDVTAGWLVTTLVLSFVGGYIGGSFAMRMGRERGHVAAVGLAVFALVLGLGSAVVQMNAGALPGDDPGSGELPTWYNFIIPFIGAAGIMLGGRRRPSE